jgi:UDPglucose 6-dehydrogenase
MTTDAHYSVAVTGLWHLGTVTAACLASCGIRTLAFDPDPSVVERLAAGQPPVFEPGLAELVQEDLTKGTLRVTSSAKDVGSADLVWVTWDTPVDEDDRADVESVLGHIANLFPHLADNALVVVSSQLPIGSVRRLERAFALARPQTHVSFASSPENLRLGRAIDAFVRPDRVIVGVRSEQDARRFGSLLEPLGVSLKVMRVESAELTKHALNAFLATSVAFINEVARIGEAFGADASEVESGLKSDVRLGPRAYLHPGGAYSGGTLARDVEYLIDLGERVGLRASLFQGVHDSNEAHRRWSFDALARLLPTIPGSSVAVLGLTYKPGTDTLRRSPAVDLCERLVAAGARVVAYDPVVKRLPVLLSDRVELASSAERAIAGAAAVVVATEWPEFRTIDPSAFIGGLDRVVVLDAGGFLGGTLRGHPRIHYVTVGTVS